MKQGYFFLAIQVLLVSAMCATPVAAQESLDALRSEIIQAVQKSVDLMKENLVDIVAREEITIGEDFNRQGKPRRTTNILSEYRVFPEKTADISLNCRAAIELLVDTGRARAVIREERKVLSRKGDYSNVIINEYFDRIDNFIDLAVTFDKQNEKCFNYELRGFNEIGGRKVYVIDISGKERLSIRASTAETWDFWYIGRASIDAETMTIVQLSRGGIDTYAGSSRGNVTLFVKYEFDQVKIRDQFLTLPVAKTVESFIRNTKNLDMLWEYRYSDYKAFGVDAKITFGATEELSIEEQPETE